MKKYTHLFFDLDRTLWDFETNAAEVLLEIYIEFGLQMYFKSIFGFSRAYHQVNSVLWEKYRLGEISKDILRWKRFYDTLSQFNCDDVELAKKIGEIYVVLSSKSTNLFSGTIETLSVLSKNYKQFILTNGFKEIQHIKVVNCKLDKYVERVFTSEEAGQMKPSEVFYNYVLEQLNVNPENCLMIGDDELADVEGAKNCNIAQVFFNPNNKKTNCTPTYEINKLSELLEIL